MKILTAKVGSGLLIGQGHPIVVQTMCNTHTADIEASVAQCRLLASKGAQLIRLTTQGMREVEALAEIKSRLRNEGIMTPLVADVHFSSDVALAVARIADKVRINPGNFARDHDVACSKFAELINICKEYGTAIRIGLNHGSLGERITGLYGNTPQAMKEAVMEWLEMCIAKDFFNVVVSLKASNTLVMSQAYILLYGAMKERGYVFPMHLGVTEAGNGDSGRIKSAVGIATLLEQGIGDTIRVSLTEPPENELPVAAYLADRYGTCEVPVNTSDWENTILDYACTYGPALLSKRIDDFEVHGQDEKTAEYIKDEIMQAARRRFYRPEYIACPGCGRTMYNLEEAFNEVKEKTSHLKGLRIAVMGCIVNGPGEMADADWGYVGEGAGMVSIYKGKDPVLRHVPQDKAVDELLRLISEN